MKILVSTSAPSTATPKERELLKETCNLLSAKLPKSGQWASKRFKNSGDNIRTLNIRDSFIEVSVTTDGTKTVAYIVAEYDRSEWFETKHFSTAKQVVDDFLLKYRKLYAKILKKKEAEMDEFKSLKI